MKVKIMKKDGSFQLIDCEDVTITYYTEGSVAFQDAKKNWDRQLAGLRSSSRNYDANLKSAQTNAAELRKQISEVEIALQEHATKASGWQRWLSRIFPVVARRLDRRAAELEKRLRFLQTRAQAVAQHVQRQSLVANKAVRAVNEMESDPLTPGIELAIRLRDRSSKILGIPADGDVVYFMNDAGKTTDKVEWPPKSLPAALRAG